MHDHPVSAPEQKESNPWHVAFAVTKMTLAMSQQELYGVSFSDDSDSITKALSRAHSKVIDDVRDRAALSNLAKNYSWRAIALANETLSRIES